MGAVAIFISHDHAIQASPHPGVGACMLMCHTDGSPTIASWMLIYRPYSSILAETDGGGPFLIASRKQSGTTCDHRVVVVVIVKESCGRAQKFVWTSGQTEKLRGRPIPVNPSFVCLCGVRADRLYTCRVHNFSLSLFRDAR